MMLVVPATCCLGDDDCCLESTASKRPLAKSLKEHLDLSEPVVPFGRHSDASDEASFRRAVRRQVADAELLMRLGRMSSASTNDMEWFLDDLPDATFKQPRPLERRDSRSDSDDDVAFE